MHKDLSIDFILDKIEIETDQERKLHFVNELVTVSKALRADQKDAIALKAKLDNQEEELDNLEQGTNHLQNELDNYSEEIASLKEQLQTADNKIQELQTLCFDHEQREESLTANLEDEKAERGRAELANDQAYKVIAELRARITELEKEIELI